MSTTSLSTRCATAVVVLAALSACASDDSDVTDGAAAATVAGASATTGSSVGTVPPSAPSTEPPATVAPLPDTLPPNETLAPRAIGASTGPLPGLAPQFAPAGPGPVEFATFERSFSIDLADPMNVAEAVDHVVVESSDGTTRLVFFTSDAFVNAESELYADRLVDPRSELQAGRLLGLPVSPLDAWLSELDAERLITLQGGGFLLVGTAPRDYWSFVASQPTIDAATGTPTLAVAGLNEAVVQIVGDTQYRIYELDDADDAWYALVTDPSITDAPNSSTTPVDNLLRTLDETDE